MAGVAHTPHSDEFGRLIVPFALERLDEMEESVCALLPDYRIGYVNPAWVAFGLANGATREWISGLGLSVLDVVPDVLRAFHETLLTRARSSQEPVDHEYDCSTPFVHRLFRMRIHPCASGAFVILHSLVRETPAGDHRIALESLYRDARGLFVQCSNCRRVRRTRLDVTAPDVWDWVPEYVARLPQPTSHSICRICADYYYGGIDET